MDKKNAALGALAGLALTGAVVGSVSAQSTAEATGLTMQQAIGIALQEVSGVHFEPKILNAARCKNVRLWVKHRQPHETRWIKSST
ncbi:hypothetical protein [Ruegeria arenilitoris]|uniref:hypothetical protein n=1 Tax=Ruegeria arenilitoris TaxID=1173585 RepID=UPI001481B0B3|nr:hypothetical protein [Ruegeria arenilitoris]